MLTYLYTESGMRDITKTLLAWNEALSQRERKNRNDEKLFLSIFLL